MVPRLSPLAASRRSLAFILFCFLAAQAGADGTMASQIIIQSPARAGGLPVVPPRHSTPSPLDALLQGLDRQQHDPLLPAAGARARHNAGLHRATTAEPPKLALQPVPVRGQEAPAAVLGRQPQPAVSSPSFSLFHTLFHDGQYAPWQRGQQVQQGQHFSSDASAQPRRHSPRFACACSDATAAACRLSSTCL